MEAKLIELAKRSDQALHMGGELGKEDQRAEQDASRGAGSSRDAQGREGA